MFVILNVRYAISIELFSNFEILFIAITRYCLLSKIYIDIYSVLKSTFVPLYLPRRILVNIIMNIQGFVEDVNTHHNLLQLIPIE